MSQDNQSPTPPSSQDGATDDPPARQPSAARPMHGLTVGFGVLALVGLPAYFTGIFALAAFSGCFIGCAEPHPAFGALWTGITVLLLTIPGVAGVVAARVRPRGAWLAAAFAAGALVTAWHLTQTPY